MKSCLENCLSNVPKARGGFSESRTNQTCRTLHLGNTKQAGLHLKHIHPQSIALKGVLTTLHVSHADHSQLTLLVVAAFAVYIFARMCLLVSELPAANSAHLCMAHFNTQNLNLAIKKGPPEAG